MPAGNDFGAFFRYVTLKLIHRFRFTLRSSYAIPSDSEFEGGGELRK